MFYSSLKYMLHSYETLLFINKNYSNILDGAHHVKLHHHLK